MATIDSAVTQAEKHDGAAPEIHAAVLDKAHLGDIHGALGSIAEDDVAPRATLGTGSEQL